MSTGIVCEFNPFHNGHAYLISEAARITKDNIVCVMSGNFVQRGEFSVADKFLRADWAIRSGADLVVENPFPFCSASAEYFAASAVKVLSRGGLCDKIAFGTEEGNKEDFFELARILLEENTKKEIAALVKQSKNVGFAAARESYISQKYGAHLSVLVSSPNSLLGVEYAKAILKQNIDMDIVPVKRKGAQHDGGPCGMYSGATYLREMEDVTGLSAFCPEYVASALEKTRYKKVDTKKLYAALSAKLLFEEGTDIRKTAELSWDYAEKIKKNISKFDNFEEFFDSLRSKHITDAHIRRALVFLLSDIKKENLKKLPDSSLILAFSECGAKIIKQVKKQGDFTLMSKISDMKKLCASDKENFEKELSAERLFLRLLK